MDHHEALWTTEDGISLYSQGWLPASGRLRGVVLLVHGLGEHSGRYTELAHFLTGNGMAVQSFDLRGHGRSGGARGHSPSYEHLMRDIDLLLADADQRHPGSARILYGHSLGGQLVLNYTLRRHPHVSGVVATSPALRTWADPPPITKMLGRVLGSVIPTAEIHTGLDSSGISRDPGVVAAYCSDPLIHDRISLGLAKGSMAAVDWVYAHASEFDVPLLLVHGTGDRLAYPHGSQQFAELVGSDCTLKLWEGSYHELHNEPEKDQVLAYILGWIDEHINP